MLVFRELRRDDIPTINQWRQSEELIALLGAPYRYIGLEVDFAWFDSYLRNRNSTVRCVTVEESDPKTPLCLTTLSNIDWTHRSCELHIMIGDKHSRGKGIGRFSVSEIVSHAFNNLNLHRVELTVLDSNIPARKLYEKIGFEYEGIKRESAYKQGKYVDQHIMALLKGNWLRPVEGQSR